MNFNVGDIKAKMKEASAKMAESVQESTRAMQAQAEQTLEAARKKAAEGLDAAKKMMDLEIVTAAPADDAAKESSQNIMSLRKNDARKTLLHTLGVQRAGDLPVGGSLEEAQWQKHRMRALFGTLKAEKVSEDTLSLTPSSHLPKEKEKEKHDCIKVARAIWTYESEPGEKVWLSVYLDLNSGRGGSKKSGMTTGGGGGGGADAAAAAAGGTAAAAAAAAEKSAAAAAAAAGKKAGEKRLEQLQRPLQKPPPEPPARRHFEQEKMYMQVSLNSALIAHTSRRSMRILRSAC
jgi:hypothetical protein